MTRVETARTGAVRRVFLSYARKDGAETARILHGELEGAGHEVWRDTVAIKGGAVWSKDIEEGLNQCDVVVAVCTRASFTSEICRAEQIWALDRGKLVIPVLAGDDTDVLPVFLHARNYRKFPEQRAELLADLAGAGAGPPMVRALRYDTIPNLPQNFVMREKALQELRDLVFAEGAGGNIAVTAMAGMGGIGKTVLATALCRDLAVQRAFPDGIAWITLGRERDGDFVTRMREVARALGDDLSGYDNALACENRYRTVLREKAALVVVDDVWNLADLKALLVEAPRSRFLFTTRDAKMPSFVAARAYAADLLSEPEARNLLMQWSGTDPLPSEADDIIRECGHLAAAVAQIGALLRGASPAEWRRTVQALREADISSIEKRLPLGQRSFFRSLAVSFEALRDDVQACYLKLAVLLEDVPAPLAVLQTLWGADDREVMDTAGQMVDRSLAFWLEAGHPERGIRLHDLQLDYVRAKFEDQKALRLIHEALRLSAHVVASHPEEFASQMVGRLLGHGDVDAVGEFIEQITRGAYGIWLKPLWPALHPPGTELIRTLSGHTFYVNAVAMTADGKRVVSGGSDRTLRVWDLESGRQLSELRGHSESINAVAVTADGKRAISASSDPSLKVWDLESGQEVRTLTGHSETVADVVLAVDGKRALSASWDNTLKVWDVESGREFRTLAGHSNCVAAVALTADGTQALSASWDQTLSVWDIESGRQLGMLTGHSDRVSALALTADGKRAVSGSFDKTLKVWDVESRREIRTLVGHSDVVEAVALTADGRRAVSGSRDKTLKVWDIESGREIRTLAGHSGGVYSVVLTGDGKRAVSASDDSTLKVWDLENVRPARTLLRHSAPVKAVALAADGKRAASASGVDVKVWDIDGGRELDALDGRCGSVNGVALRADGKRAVSAHEDKKLKVWDLDSGSELRTLKGHSSSVTAVALSTDGKWAASASDDRTVRVWDVERGRLKRTLGKTPSPATAVALTADGTRVISSSESPTLRVWDVGSERKPRELYVRRAALVTSVALTADGTRAVCASWGGTLEVVDVDSGRELGSLAGHSGPVTAVALGADGKRAVSVSWDNTLKVWDVERGECIATFHCEGMSRCCAFSGDHHILAGDEGGRLYLLSLEGV